MKGRWNPNSYANRMGIIDLSGCLDSTVEMKSKEEAKKFFTVKDQDGYVTTAKPNNGYDRDYGFDVQEWIRFPPIDLKNMHQINDNLATGAIGCDIPSGWIVVPVYDLEDSELNISKVKDRITFVSKLLDEGHKVCVCCAAGLNRSNTIAVGTLMYRDKRNMKVKKLWNSQYNNVRKKVPAVCIYPTIKQTCKLAVAELRE